MPASEDFTPLDTLKRYLEYRPLGNDPWTNTMRGTSPAPGQGFAPADPVLYPTASPLVNITEGDIKRATDVGLAASGGGLKGQQIRAYHSSPHDFDKFDLSKIGTGEGAQVYGHGLYLAESPKISGQGGHYWNQFLPRFKGNERAAATELAMNKFDRETSIANLQERIAKTNEALKTGTYPEPARYGTSREKYEGMLRDQKSQLDMLTSDKPIGPRTYEVDIKADPAHMLDWDKRFFQQSPEVQERLRSIGINPPEVALPGQFSPTGRDIYTQIGIDRMGRNTPTPVLRRAASEGLGEAGIPGIRYLDEGSRYIPEQLKRHRDLMNNPNTTPAMRDKVAAYLAEWENKPITSNYVVRDPSILDIVKKYGLAGLAAPPAIAGAMRDKE